MRTLAAVTLAFLVGMLLSPRPEAHAAAPWSPTGNLITARQDQSETLLPNGKVLIAAGEQHDDFLNSAELYDPATGQWTATGSLVEQRWDHTATLLSSGKVLVAGGTSMEGPPTVTELYDPASGTWSLTGALNTGRYYHTATLLQNGKVLVAGGFNSAADLQFLSSAELYDPATGTWTVTGSMTTPRYDHTATLLPNGKVLVAGGWNANSYLSSAELYDPATGTWSATGSMSRPRSYYTATLLSNGKVLAMGGYSASANYANGYFYASAELYDPAAGTWSFTGSMATARGYYASAKLANGTVLVTGGVNSNGYLSSAEVYDPAAGTWSAAGSMSTPRVYHTATLLPSGQVLVAGGSSATSGYLGFDSTFLNSSELYTPGNGGSGSGTGQIYVSPASGSYSTGTTFTAYVVTSGGTPFRAASATVSVSPNLSVLSIAAPPANYGPCNFSSLSVTPTPANPSFAGSYAPGYAASACTVYAMTLEAMSSGAATITISNGSVVAYSGGGEEFGSPGNASYTLTGASVTPTSTPTSTPTATPTSTPTGTPTTTPTSTAPATGTLSFYPYSGTYATGSTFTVTLYAFGNGSNFSAVQATVSLPGNLRAVSLYPGTCNLSYSTTPTAANPSFAGTAPAGTSGCAVYSLTVQAVGAGTGTIAMSTTSMTRASDGTNMLKAVTNGSYTVN